MNKIFEKMKFKNKFLGTLLLLFGIGEIVWALQDMYKYFFKES